MAPESDRVLAITAEARGMLSFEPFYDRLRHRLAGITDHEYLWEPVPGSWSIEDTGEGRHRAHPQWPEPDAAPVPTIAWRVAHISHVLRGERNWRWLGREPEVLDADVDHPLTAAGGIALLEASYGAWTRLMASFDGCVLDLWEPIGPIGGPYATASRFGLVVHQLDEFIHHSAEVALLRDLYRATANSTD